MYIYYTTIVSVELVDCARVRVPTLDDACIVTLRDETYTTVSEQGLFLCNVSAHRLMSTIHDIGSATETHLQAAYAEGRDRA